MPEARHIALVGAMGSGKSTIGARVAVALGVPFLDNDQLLERAAGSTAADLAAREGIEALHRAEAAVVLDALRAPDASVIAAAASTITDAAVRAALHTQAWVVWLHADHDTLVERMPGSKSRPYGDHDREVLVREQSRRRDPLFAEVADATFATDTGAIDAVVARVVASAGERGLRVER